VPGLGVLNHVITCLPDLQLYADSTAPNIELHERLRIALLPNFRVLDPPGAASAQDRFLDFHSTYAYDGNTNVVTVTRDGCTCFASEVCSREDFTQMRAGLETLSRDVRAQVIVRSTLSDAVARR
jgi:hypothetical protein